MAKHQIYIGTSGWSYKHWRGTFYPEATKVKDQFAYYFSKFDSVEINNSFYRLPTKETFLRWKEEVPENFKYVLKASRYITHLKRLRDSSESLGQFLSHATLLGTKLGAVLFQLPPNLKYDDTLLSDFLRILPKGFRYAFEFRNPEWYRDEVYNLLKNYNCAFCIYELAGHLSPIKVTADFVYVRLHGPGKKYQGSYQDEILSKWAGHCRKWLKSHDVFVYFDNDEKGYAAFNALKLKALASK